MADVFMYADETGDLDMTGSPGASTYFGFGTAVFADRHGDELWQGMHLRCQLERKGVHLPRGMHAKNDSHATREIVLCVWDAASSWGVQVADYGLWAVQRQLEGRSCLWYPTHVQPSL